ncbi:MAG: Rab family GTPase [Ardenticatenaceae bacterium]
MGWETSSKKVCLLGDYAVGKTSLVRRYVYDNFDDKYHSTVGVNVSRKSVTIPGGGGPVAMMIWDLAGGDEFRRVRESYLRGAAGAVLVCDVSRPETVSSLRVYAGALLDINPETQFVLAANKSDLATPPQITLSEIEAAMVGLRCLIHPTSAKSGEEVDLLFHALARRLVP